MKRVLSLLLCTIFIASLLLPACYASTQIVERDEPVVSGSIDVSAYSAIVVDMKTGEPLFEYDADEKNYPASTTKVMTAYLCLKYGDPDDIITVSSDAFSDVIAIASVGDLRVGEEMTVRRLLKELLVISASEAANVVGEYISGSHEKFVDLMNEEAKALGCTNTHFANCHGLPNTDHTTTARDMAKIAAAAMEYDVFREIVGSAYTTLEATNKTNEKTIQSTNGILPGSSYTEYNYPYAIGIKTGHTNDAGYCLISAAEKDDTQLLCVIMGCGSRTSSFAQTIRLYDWAFDNYEALTFGLADKYVQTEDLTEEIDEDANENDVEGIVTDKNSVANSVDFEAEKATEEASASVENETPEVIEELAVPSEELPNSVITVSELEVQSNKLTLSDLTFENLTGPLLPLLIFFVIIFVLVILLIITITIAIIKRRE